MRSKPKRHSGAPGHVIDPIRPESAFVSPLPDGFRIGLLTPCERAAVLWRWEYCSRFLKMERAGLTDRTDAAMTHAIDFIWNRLCDECTPEYRIQSSRNGRKIRAGTMVMILEPPQPFPAELRSWLQAIETTGDPTVFADRSRCEMRGDAHPHDPPAPPPGPVTEDELDALPGRWLTRKEARRFMPATVAVLRALIDAHLIPSKEFTDKPGVVGYTMIRGEDVLDYRRKFASVALLGKEAGIDPRILLKMINAAGIVPAFDPDLVGANIYRRSDVSARFARDRAGRLVLTASGVCAASAAGKG